MGWGMWIQLVVAAILWLSPSANSARFLQSNRDGALVVSAKGYHYEIVAFFCYHLHQLGFDVHTFLTQHARRSMEGVAFNYIYPFVKSVQFFPTNERHEALEIPPRLKVLIYITMNTKEEYTMMCAHKLHETVYNLSEHVIMVSHRASHVSYVSNFCKAPKCTIFHLAEHVHRAAVEYVEAEHITDVQLAYANAAHEQKWQPQAPEKATVFMNDFTPSTRLLVIQGNMDVRRRRYDLLFDCMRKLRGNGTDVRLISLGGQMIGFSKPSDLQKYVSVLQYLPFPDFFSVIQHADFVVSFLNGNNSYDSIRSSSSVPAAIMNKVPIILPQTMLNQYSCLREISFLRSIARDEDCESLTNALALSKEQYKKLWREINRCSEEWIQSATIAIGSIVLKEYNKDDAMRSVPRCSVKKSRAANNGSTYTSGPVYPLREMSRRMAHISAPKRKRRKM